LAQTPQILLSEASFTEQHPEHKGEF
jgi:hypothetical protein